MFPEGSSLFLQLVLLGTVALLIAPSGIGRGEPLMIAPPGAYGPMVQMVVPPGGGGAEVEAPVDR